MTCLSAPLSASVLSARARLPAPCCSWNKRIAPRAGDSSQTSQKVSPAMVTSHERRQPASQEHTVQQALSCLSYPHWIETETILPQGPECENSTSFIVESYKCLFYFCIFFPCAFSFTYPHSCSGRVSTTPLPANLMYSPVPSPCRFGKVNLNKVKWVVWPGVTTAVSSV